jgi:hypothetical protein
MTKDIQRTYTAAITLIIKQTISGKSAKQILGIKNAFCSHV